MTLKYRVGIAIALFCGWIGVSLTEGHTETFLHGAIFSLSCLLVLASYKDFR